MVLALAAFSYGHHRGHEDAESQCVPATQDKIIGPWFWDRLITDDEIAALYDCVTGVAPEKPCIEVHPPWPGLEFQNWGPICNLNNHLIECGAEHDDACWPWPVRAEEPKT